LGWSGGGRLDGENYGFEVGTSKLFNNSTTFPKKIWEVSLFLGGQVGEKLDEAVIGS
jgi:hypothetical protein